jgi:flavin reductase (DIM6/NTAB) family NADH-FMN oxidoreductase RutF
MIVASVYPSVLANSSSTDISPTASDSADYRRALGAFATGVTIVTAHTPGGAPLGLTVNSFASLSLEPPLVVWSQSRRSRSLSGFLTASHYVVNVLAADQVALSNRFANPHADKFANMSYGLSRAGAPILNGVVAYFECGNELHHDGGDHILFVGRVEAYGYERRPTLIFCHGGYLPADSAGAEKENIHGCFG